MFVKLLILSAVFLFIAFAGLGIRVLFRREGKFPETHAGRNREMRKLGISCAKNTDVGCHSTEGFPGCPACEGSRLCQP
jgi:hypothetical protein